MRAAVFLEAEGGKMVLFHAFRVLKVCTLVPSLLHALGVSSFCSVQISTKIC